MRNTVTPLRVGDVLGGDGDYGDPTRDVYVGGYFDDDYDGPFRVEAIGADWLVVRGSSGRPHCHIGEPEELLRYRR